MAGTKRGITVWALGVLVGGGCGSHATESATDAEADRDGGSKHTLDAGKDGTREDGGTTLDAGSCDASSKPAAFVQVASATPQSAGMSTSVAYAMPEVSGDLNVIVVAWNDATHSVVSVTDGSKNAYTRAVGPTVGANITQSIYYAAKIAGGSNQVTVAFDSAVDNADIRVLEYSGVGSLDGVASGTGSISPATTSQITTTAPHNLLVAAGTTSGDFSAAGSNYTQRIITQPDGDIVEDEIVSQPGSYSATAPTSGSWVMQLVAFKGAATCSMMTGSSAVAVSPPAAGVTPTQTRLFTATVQGLSNMQVTWAVDGIKGGSGAVGAISNAGLYTPPASAGVHTVTATSVADTTKSGTATVAVTDLAGVLTTHNDIARTGQNSSELALTIANVNQGQFGKLFSLPVDGYVYAQPLWVPGVSFGGVKHNAVFVATENNSVYAFDADQAGSPLWRVSLGTPVPDGDTGDTADLVPQLGVSGTPVIDAAASILYVVAETKDAGATYHHRLHALDLATGSEKLGGPVDINPTVSGTGGNSSGGMVQYSPIDHFQRPALLLLGGVVYVPIGSNADTDPDISHGWVVGYSTANLSQVLAYCASPNGTMASIWQSGAGIAVDSSSNMYFETGNGTFDANTGGTDYGNSAIKMNASGAVLDWFTPYNQDVLDANDIDLGSAGPVVLPDQPGPVPHELLVIGKPGFIFVVNRDNMGHYQSGSNSQIVQSVEFAANTTSVTGGSYATIAYFNETAYFADSGVTGDGKLKAYSLTNGLLSTSPTSESPTAYAYPGATPSVSSHGASNGIVWSLEGQGYTPSTAPVLHAYAATNLGTELYNSSQAGARDTPGPAVKFAVPTVANGKVYAGTQTEITVFGLLP
jgi:hypothetical protein